MPWVISLYVIIFLYGIVIGSFLNVCIFRLPLKQDIVKVRSHCMSCDYQLKWYDLVPLFSYLFLKGRCRKCGAKISPQYPIIEATNGVLYVLVFLIKGINVDSLLYSLLFSALLALSIIDFRTYEIPVGFNYFIAALGLIKIATDYKNWSNYLLGAVCVSLFLLILFFCSKGRAIGGGDIKLMAAAGLLIGWKLIVLAFFVGCILGAIIHLIRMRVSKAGRVLAMGPYLSMGIALAVLWGDRFITWYLSLLGL